MSNFNTSKQKAKKTERSSAAKESETTETTEDKVSKYMFPSVRLDHIATLTALGVQATDLLLASYIAGMCAYSKSRMYKIRHIRTMRDFGYSITKITATFKRLVDCGFIILHSRPFGKANRYILSENTVRAFLDPEYRKLLVAKDPHEEHNPNEVLPSEYVGLFTRDWKHAGAPKTPTLVIPKTVEETTASKTGVYTPTKRGRGRPPKQKSSSGYAIW